MSATANGGGIIDNIAVLYSTLFAESSIHLHCALTGIANDDTFTTSTGFATTYIKLTGTRNYTSTAEYLRTVEVMLNTLRESMQNTGVIISVMFDYNPNRVEQFLSDTLRPIVNAVRVSPIRMDDIFKVRYPTLFKTYVRPETVLISVSTSYASPNRIFPAGTYSYGSRPIPAEALAVHQRRVGRIMDVLAKVFHTKKLSIHEAMGELERLTNPSNDFRPPKEYQLPGRTAFSPSTRANQANHADASGLLPLPIAEQIFRDDLACHPEDDSIVRTRGYCFAPVSCKAIPYKCLPFNELLQSIPPSIPFRATFTVVSGHRSFVARIRNKQWLARTVKIFSSRNNGEILSGINSLLDNTSPDNPMVAVVYAFSTFGRTLEEALSHRAVLETSLSGWGSPITALNRDNAALALISTMPGVSAAHIGSHSYTDLQSYLHTLPFYRSVSPFTRGSLMFLTSADDGIFPFEVGSPLQTSYANFVYAEQGMGKSVLLQLLVLASLFSGRNGAQIPLIAGIDIGPSMSFLANLLRDLLPDDQRGLVITKKISNTAEYVNNPFDTFPGLRYPLSFEESFLRNFLTTLISPSLDSQERIGRFVSQLLLRTYEWFDRQAPKEYRHGDCPDVDRALSRTGVAVPVNPTWHEIADTLFDAGCYEEWILAHRQAMPTLRDLSTVLYESDALKAQFRDYYVEDNDIIREIAVGIDTALTTYKVLDGATTFGTDSSSYTVVDLQSVIPSNAKSSLSGQRSAAIWFMWARNAIGKRLLVHPDNAADIQSPKYRAYYEREFAAIQIQLKVSLNDEIHMYMHLPPAIETADFEARISRKCNIIPVYSTQMLGDLPPKFINLFPNIWVMTKPSREDWALLRSYCGVAEDVYEGFERYIHMPDAKGSTMAWLGRLGDETSRCCQFLRLPLPLELGWATASTTEDAAMRKAVAQRIGGSNSLIKALYALAGYYRGRSPVPSCKKHVVRTSGDNGITDEEAIATIANEIAQTYTAAELKRRTSVST